MNLFNKYQSRVLQFALELLTRLQGGAWLSAGQLQDLAGQWGLDYADQVVSPLCRAGVLERVDGSCRLAPGQGDVRLPLSAAERSYLSAALALPEAELFLDEPLREKLTALSGELLPEAVVQRYAPTGEALPRIAPEDFRTLLKAIRQRRMVEYAYCTRESDTLHEAKTLPWKLEYSAFDGRWWVILYDLVARRTIKARLEHLENIRLLGPANVSETEIVAAMERLLEPEPVVLEVERTRGALERCFLVFENQLFERTQQLTQDRFRLSFRWYRFDRQEILRRLLYLGPGVRLVSPVSLRQDLTRLVEQALKT